MTENNQLSQIENILSIRYEQQRAGFEKLVAREFRLRQDIDLLNKYLLDSRQDSLRPSEMRLIGADIAWQAWIGRKKAAFNIELAQVLSIKAYHLKQVKKIYGKLLVAQELGRQNHHLVKSRMARNVLSQAIDMSAFKPERDPAQ